jgi:hypothetical protein
MQQQKGVVNMARSDDNERRLRMDRYQLGLAMSLVLFASSLAYAEQPSGSATDSLQVAPGGHYFATGVVENITDGMVQMKMDKDGITREFSLKAVKQEKIKGVTVGTSLRLELDENDMIIDIGRVGPGSVKRLEKVREVKGTVERYDPLKRVVTLKLGNGKFHFYTLKDAAAVKMNDVQTGIRVTLQLDPRNNMVEDFKTLQ